MMLSLSAKKISPAFHIHITLIFVIETIHMHLGLLFTHVVTINKVLMVNMFQKNVTIILEVQKALL